MLNKKRLSNTEFEVMKVVWNNEPPITTSMVMEQLGKQKKWKLATILTILSRLVEKGFVTTEKFGKERLYYPAVIKEDYLAAETKIFLENYHDNSIKSFMDFLLINRDVSKADIEELIQLLKNKENNEDEGQ